MIDPLQVFEEISSGQPGTTSLIEHQVEVTDSKPIRVRQYPVFYAKRQDMDREV